MRSTPGAPPPIAPLAGTAIPASMAPTAAVRVVPPVGKPPEERPSVVVPAGPPILPVAQPDPESESPTITTGRRMGEVIAKGAAAVAAAPPPKKCPLAVRGP